MVTIAVHSWGGGGSDQIWIESVSSINILQVFINPPSPSKRVGGRMHSSMTLYINHVQRLSLPSKNETMAPLHVATLTLQRELPKYEIIFSI